MDLFLSLELMRGMQMETENEICLAVALFMITYCIVRISRCCTYIRNFVVIVKIYFVWFLTPSIRARMAS